MKEKNNEFHPQEETPQIKEGDAAAGSSFSWRKVMSRKWVFPAMYMAVAAIILTIMWVYQDTNNRAEVDKETSGTEVTETVGETDTMEAAALSEKWQWPVKDRNQFEVTLPYYDSNASNESRQAAMIEYGDTFTAHVGIDLARENDEPFDVLAAASGTVTQVDSHAIVGNLVEIETPDGLVTVYQSLSEVNVQKGAKVKKGDVIGKAGRNELEKDEGVHLHFEVRDAASGKALNPAQYLPE